MSRKQMIFKWVERVMMTVFLLCYSVSIITLCWLLTTPDLAAWMEVITHNQIWSTLIFLGFFASILLFFNAFFEAIAKLSPFSMGQGNWQDALIGLGDIGVGLSSFFVPLTAVEHNLFLRSLNQPTYLWAITGLFLLGIIEHCLNTTKRAKRSRKGVVHA